MRRIKHRRLVAAVFALLIGGGSAGAQTEQSAPNDQRLQYRAALIDSTEEYKASTEELLRLDETEASRAATRLEQLRQLFAEGIIARREIEEAEQSLAAAEARLQAARGQIADADRVIAETKAEIEAIERAAAARQAQPAQIQSAQSSRYSQAATVIRYTGYTSWSVANLAGVQAFFLSRFNRPLPTSAVGQTATHNSLGFDHRHAVDVALHPDSAEGRALINYLQSAGIPFLAFRAAVAGSSTGAHIHIGRPSHRIA